MYICLCHSVTDADIREAVDSGVRTVRHLQLATRCSTGCGKCLEAAEQEMLCALEERQQMPRIIATPAAA
jgi:bacterioferritin-associated ferredoxin